MKTLLMIAAAIALTACASHGQPITQEQVSRVTEGKTTRQELIASFGPPTVSTRNSDGSEILSWGHAKIGFAGSSYKNQTMTAVIGPDGKVVSYSTSDIGG